MTKYSDIKKPAESQYSLGFFNGEEIQVLKHLSSQDKYDLIMITLQKSKEEGCYNPIKMDIFFHLHLAYLYTDVDFSEDDRKDEFALYDELVGNGFMDMLLSTIDEKEYTELSNALENLASDLTNYNRTASAILQKIVTDLPTNAEAAAKIIDNFDPEKYQQVIKFAEAANGGRPITN